MTTHIIPEFPTVEALRETFLPVLFTDPDAISRYGESVVSPNAGDRYSSLIEKSAVSSLARCIVEIKDALTEADPRRIAKKPSWFSRFAGTHVEKVVRYQNARSNVKQLVEAGKALAVHVKELLAALQELSDQYEAETARLQVYLNAGRLILNEIPESGPADALSVMTDNPRERFKRKLTNLATLLASHEMSIMHMRIVRANAIDMLDRFNEAACILVPVWGEHTLSLLTAKYMKPEMIAQATQAHKALMTSLNNSIEGIEK
ncbi:protein KlaA [Escherichia coli]|nr:protein KlaA [Escherichia coli]EES5680351.1 protein KlaA [Escherichia coli]